MGVKWITVDLDVGEKTYTATEPSTADVEEMMLAEKKPGDGMTALDPSVELVRSCIARRHPEVTADEIRAGLPPRLLHRAVTTLLEIANVPTAKPGEAARP